MAITQDDVRLFASERMTDYEDGGGRMSPDVVIDGLDNNVFPDVTDIDRISGRVALRKVFGAVISEDTDQYLSAHAFLDDAPDDEATSAVLIDMRPVVGSAGLTAEREDVIDGIVTREHAVKLHPAASGDATMGSDTVEDVTSSISGVLSDLYGTHCRISSTALGAAPVGSEYPACVRVFVASPGDGEWQFDKPLPFSGSVSLQFFGFEGLTSLEQGTTCRGVSPLTAAADAGDLTLTVDTVIAQVAGWAEGGAMPTLDAVGISMDGVGWSQYLDVTSPAYYHTFRIAAGNVLIIRSGDSVLLHHTVAEDPDTVANSDVVDVGRTGLARLRVIGSTGVEHARFTRGVPDPSGVGCTADLDAGEITFTDVSGMAQPVTIEHRIEELNMVSLRVGNDLTLNRPLARDFPLGTKVSSLLLLGDLQGRVQAGFAQQAWTGAWSDERIGGEPTADLNDVVYPITCENKGAVTQRWAAIFTNSGTFRVIGEFVGEVGIGNTALDFSPNNPATSAPYFTIPSLGWGAGWSAGNVYRFNTVGAQAPLWVLRCVAPSLPGGDDSVTVEFRGYINA